jgi:hypothetical protein
MKFTLTYDGELRPNSDPRRKSEIRKQFHPQLEALWSISPALHVVKLRRYIPQTGYYLIESHHKGDSVDNIQNESIKNSPHIDLCATIDRSGHQFLPVVRDILALQCGLKIIFLSKERPGKIFQGSDLDNRLKTLFDALAIPNDDQIISGGIYASPIHCLLEDDRMISSLAVETRQLLSHSSASDHEVRLLIEVEVKVMNSRFYNRCFLGD